MDGFVAPGSKAFNETNPGTPPGKTEKPRGVSASLSSRMSEESAALVSFIFLEVYKASTEKGLFQDL